MNIFLIPSWYPRKNNTISGTFTKEQSVMIAEMYWNEVNFFVSVVTTYSLSPRNIKQSIRNLISYKNSKKEIVEVDSNYLEYTSFALSWSRYIFNGNFNALVKNHRKILITMLNSGIKIDIIHAHVSYPAGYVAYLLSQEFSIPYIITEHMGPFPFKKYIDNNKPIKEIELAINNAQKVIAVSDSLKNDIVKFGYKEPIVIPNFIDDDKYKLINKIVSKNNKFIFLTVGNMVEQKGIDILLESIALIKSKIDNIEFRIVGDGLKLESYISLSKELKITHLVNFLGKKNRDEVIEEFENCHAFVLPSKHESFGIVYIEALACGKPIIATRCGGPVSIVNKINGLLIDRDDSNALSAGILNIYKNYNKYDSQKIRDAFIDKFSKVVNIKKYVRVYRKVIKCVE